VAYNVTLIPGDGIGPEITEAAVRVIEATGVQIAWDRVEVSADIIRATGESIPKAAVESLERTRLGLKGPVTTPIGGGFSSVNVALRKKFNLYANVRPVKTVPGIKTRFSDTPIDLIIFRENTEDLYVGMEQEIVTDVVTSLKVITRSASVKIAQAAFRWAKDHGRKKICAVHKANILKKADGLFLKCCREVAEANPGIPFSDMIVDNASMQMVSRPEQFDMMVMPNLYGDIMSDMAAGLVGGLGVVPGANIGDDCAVFEAVHGSAPDIAGKGVANPTALLMSAVMMLQYLKETDRATKVREAIEKVFLEGKHTTADIGGKASTSEFADAIVRNLKS
jgi:isocitrate dehydrogenase (NAD+)